MSGDPPVEDGRDDGALGGADTGQDDEDDEQERAAQAARSAVARARAAAAARGLRPGAAGRVRRRRVAGEPPRVSGTGPDDRDPQAFGAGLERLVTERGWSVDLAVGGVLGRWPQVVGEQVAAHCAPEAFEDGVLVVRADSTAWATQVRLLVPTLLRRMAEELGDGVVAQLQVRGPAAPSWRKGSRTVRGRGPRDTYG